MKYYAPITKKEKLLSLGSYPEISLKEAREMRVEYRSQIKKGIDPSEEKQAQKEKANIEKLKVTLDNKRQFHKVAYKWLNNLDVVDVTKVKKIKTFERDIFSFFCEYDKEHNITSSKPINEITHGEVLEAIHKKEETAPETAKRLLSDCDRLWRFAVSLDYCKYNVIANISKKDTLKKTNVKHYPKISDKKILGELLRDMDNYHGHIIVRNALRLLPYVMLRAENLTRLKWEYVDFDKKLLTIPRSLMKVKDNNLPDFKLPLTDTAINILKETQEITGWGEWVFHGVDKNKEPLHKESCNRALRLMGYTDEVNGRKQTIHSFRGTFGSLTDTYQTTHNAPFIVRERVLDHHEKSQVVRAYTNKADYTAQMRELLEWWDSFLDGLKNDRQKRQNI